MADFQPYHNVTADSDTTCLLWEFGDGAEYPSGCFIVLARAFRGGKSQGRLAGAVGSIQVQFYGSDRVSNAYNLPQVQVEDTGPTMCGVDCMCTSQMSSTSST